MTNAREHTSLRGERVVSVAKLIPVTIRAHEPLCPGRPRITRCRAGKMLPSARVKRLHGTALRERASLRARPRAPRCGREVLMRGMSQALMRRMKRGSGSEADAESSVVLVVG